MTDLQNSKGEHVVWITKEHWIKYVRPCFIYALLMGISFLLFSLAQAGNANQVALSYVFFFCAIALILFTHHWFFWLLLGEMQARIIVTNKRVISIHERLFLRDDMIEIAFEKMKTVEAHKTSFVQNLLRYGTLQFETGAKITLVPHPNDAAKKIQQAMGLR